MRRVRCGQILAGLGSSFLATLVFGGATMAATDPTQLVWPSVSATESSTSQTDVTGVGLVVSTTSDLVATTTSAPTPSDQAVTAPPPLVEATQPLASTMIDSTTAQTAPVATVIDSLLAGGLETTKYSLWLPAVDTTTPLTATISEPGVPVTHSPTQVPSPPHATGLIAQLTDLIARLTVPLAGATGLGLGLAQALSLGSFAAIILIALTAIISNDYLSYLRRMGHSRGARSDAADSLTNTTPLLVGYSMPV